MSIGFASLDGRGWLVWSVVWLVGCAVSAACGAALVQAATVQEPASAGDSTNDGDTVTVMARGAPDLPFRGLVGYDGPTYPGLDSDSGLLYWSADGSALVGYVPLDLPLMCGPGFMNVRSDGIEVYYVNFNMPGYTGYEVPWDDEAYPRFVFSPEAIANEGLPAMQVAEDLVIEDVDGRGVLRILNASQERFYGAAFGGMRFLGSDYVEEEYMYLDPGVDLAGTDGDLYGFHIIPAEPACGPKMGVVMSAATGELVACGWANLGPLLVNLDESYSGVENPVFPDDAPSGNFEVCDRPMDMRDLDRASHGAGRQP